ncbi:MAG: hypothetical protein V2I48_02885 [Xanthomonadales bacterium]|nr:hypothetical protein [Xanthomonadales bacterium]
MWKPFSIQRSALTLPLAITAGVMDLSDIFAICRILGCQGLQDAEAYFQEFPAPK